LGSEVAKGLKLTVVDVGSNRCRLDRNK